MNYIKDAVFDETNLCGIEAMSRIEDALIRMDNLCCVYGISIPKSMNDSATLKIVNATQITESECLLIESITSSSHRYCWYQQKKLCTFIEYIKVEKHTIQIEFKSFAKIEKFSDGENLVCLLRGILMRLSNRKINTAPIANVGYQ